MRELGNLKIIDIYGYMDGGTVEVTCRDVENNLIKIEFIQKVFFEILKNDK